MLAKKKFEELKQLQNNQLLDKKILEAIKLDLIHKKEVNEDEVPKDLKPISESYMNKVLKNEVEGSISYYIVKERYDAQLQKTVRDHTKISLVEDFDDYYDEIMNLSKEVGANPTNMTYGFILMIGWIILLIGIIGGVVIMSEVFEIGFAAIISTSSFAAILFGIAEIIKRISDKK